MKGRRTVKSIIIAAFLWITILGCIAVLVKYLVIPQVRNIREDFLAGQTGSGGQYQHVIRFGLDNFSGYCILRSSGFRKQLKEQGIKLVLNDDGADYPRRLKALQRGKLQMAVFPINSFLQCGVAKGSFPATIVYVLDETVGADAIIGYKSRVENIQSLNDSSAQIVLTPDSPSEFLARIMLANFNLPEFPSNNWIVKADGSAEVYDRFRTEQPSTPIAYAMWEPEVSKALENPEAHVLLDSSMVKGYIVDVLVVERSFLIENYDAVKAFIEAYARTAFAYQDKMSDLIIEDSEASQNTISKDQALKIVKGIQWKNTLENFAHFGLQPSFHSFDNIEDILLKVSDVLVKTGMFEESQFAQEDLTDLYFDKILREMKSDGFHPGEASLNIVQGTSGGLGQETLRDRGNLRQLSEEQWEGLQQVGEFQVDPIRFGRGTSRLNVQSRHHLRDLAETLHSWPEYYVQVIGRVRSGNEDNPLALSLAKERAREAVRVLVENGIEEERIRSSAEMGDSNSADSQTVSFVVGRPQ
ncbi:MAG: OmpA family protein [Verrucomicrobiota bacterium]